MRHFYLTSGGVYIAPAVTSRSVSSYLALSTLPKFCQANFWRYISVALSLRLPLLAVNQHPVLRCPDFPRGLLPVTIWLSTTILLIFCALSTLFAKFEWHQLNQFLFCYFSKTAFTLKLIEPSQILPTMYSPSASDFL